MVSVFRVKSDAILFDRISSSQRWTSRSLAFAEPLDVESQRLLAPVQFLITIRVFDLFEETYAQSIVLVRVLRIVARSVSPLTGVPFLGWKLRSYQHSFFHPFQFSYLPVDRRSPAQVMVQLFAEQYDSFLAVH